MTLYPPPGQKLFLGSRPLEYAFHESSEPEIGEKPQSVAGDTEFNNRLLRSISGLYQPPTTQKKVQTTPTDSADLADILRSGAIGL